MNRSFRTLSALACTLLLVGQAAARDVYVSIETGANGNPGTKEQPIKFLWRAFTDLAEGDNVYVAEGVYQGQSKSGNMPKSAVSNVKIEAGWNKDFSERNPFKYLTIISPPGDKQGAGSEIIAFDCPKGGVTIDGFVIDRAPHNYYFADGEPGANKRLEGHADNSCWGYRNMNKGKSGSDPTIELLGRGAFTVRNCVLVNNAWWGIYIKAGGDGDVVIENNLVFISQGRGIEAIAGGGWGNPKFKIRNNTVIFNNTLKTTEGRALSLDPRKGAGEYLVENNVLAWCDGGGFTTKFGFDTLTLNNNKFWHCRRGDASLAGNAVANAPDFEDELTCPNTGNVRELPALTKLIHGPWLDRWSSREDPSLVVGDMVSEADLMAARAAVGLNEFTIPGYDKTYATYGELPQQRNNYSMSRYPFPMKKGELIDFATYVLPLIGAEGSLGVQPFEGKPVRTATPVAPAATPEAAAN